MSPRGDSIGRRFAADLDDLREHERDNPAEVAAIVAALVGHLRSWRPECVVSLGQLPKPEAPIVDPRSTP